MYKAPGSHTYQTNSQLAWALLNEYYSSLIYQAKPPEQQHRNQSVLSAFESRSFDNLYAFPEGYAIFDFTGGWFRFRVVPGSIRIGFAINCQ